MVATQLGYAGQAEDYDATIAVWPPIYRDELGKVRVALDVNEPTGSYQVIEPAELPQRGTALREPIVLEEPASVIVVGHRFLDNVAIGGLPRPPWLIDTSADEAFTETLAHDAKGVVVAYLDALGDRSVRRFEALLAESSSTQTGEDHTVLLRHVLGACEGNWRLERGQRLILRAAFERILGGDERFERLVRIARADREPVDVDKQADSFIVNALRRRLQPPTYDVAVRGAPSRASTITLASLVGQADPDAVRRELLLPIELASASGDLTLDFGSGGYDHHQTRVWTERSLILSLALLSSGISPTLVPTENPSIQGQLDRAGLDLFLREVHSVKELTPLQQRLQVEGELAQLWREDRPISDRPAMTGDRNRFMIANPHKLPPDRLRFFQKSITHWTNDRATELLQRRPSSEIRVLLQEAAEAASELVKNIGEHARVRGAQRAARSTASPMPAGRLDSFLEVFFTRGGRLRSGNRLHIVALDSGLGIPTTARPKLSMGLSGPLVVSEVLQGALRGTEPGRGYGLPEIAQLVDRYARETNNSPVSSRLFVASGDHEKGELTITNWRQGSIEMNESLPSSLLLGTVVWFQLPLAAERGHRSRRSRLLPHPMQTALPGLAETGSAR